jgi:hypothetical protein
MTNTHQINPSDIDVKRAELDAMFHALCADADNRTLYEQWDAAFDAYRASLLPPWSVRWAAIESLPGRYPFKDPDRRSNLNALRRVVKAAKRTVDKGGGTVTQRIEADAALVAAEDALAIYRQWPSLLTPDELERARSIPHEHQ